MDAFFALFSSGQAMLMPVALFMLAIGAVQGGTQGFNRTRREEKSDDTTDGQQVDAGAAHDRHDLRGENLGDVFGQDVEQVVDGFLRQVRGSKQTGEACQEDAERENRNDEGVRDGSGKRKA